MDNFLNAAAKGEVEPTEGVSASIICGKRAKIGTGIMDVKLDFSKLGLCKPIKTNNTSNNVKELVAKRKKNKLKKSTIIDEEDTFASI
jgi:phosphotransacetylase